MARKLIIDRFEGKFAVCEEFQPEQKGAKEKKPAKNAKEIRFFGIERAELPEGAREGSVLSIDDGGVLGQRSARADDSHIVRARFGAGLFYLRGHGARIGMRSVGDDGDFLLAYQRRHPRRVEPPRPDIEARRFVQHLRAVLRRDAADHRQAAFGYLARLGRAAEEQELLLHLNPCSRAA